MRPIDAIKYSENLVWLIGHGEFSSPLDALRRALYDLAQTSTLTLDDLRPQGRWEEYEDGQFRCSVCQKKPLEIGYRTLFVPTFCYHCGADMRGGGEDA